jgi:capsular polysaccharide biosynthesis protein
MEAWRRRHLSSVLWRSPQELGCRPVDRARLMSDRGDSALVWHARPSEQCEAGNHVLRDISVAASGRQPAFLEATKYQTKPRYFARFSHAMVYLDAGIVMARPGEILAESAVSFRWASPRLQGLRGIVDDGKNIAFDSAAIEGARMIETPVMLLCHAAHAVYGHWLMDCLPGAIRLRDELLATGRRLLTPPLQAWQRQAIAWLGLGSLIEEIDERIVLARDLLYPSHLDSSGAERPSPEIAETFAALAGGAAPLLGESPGLIYVSREGQGPKRQMENERALASALESIGFQISQPELLPVGKQAELFAAAGVVIGPHGSGLGNIGFCRPGSIVVDLLTSGMPDPWICRLSAALGHHYAYHVTGTEPATRIDEQGRRVANPAARYAVDVPGIVSLARAAAQRAGSSWRRGPGPLLPAGRLASHSAAP